MKKSWLLIVFMIVIVCVVATSATYAFYTNSKLEFYFSISSASGSVLGLTLSESSNPIIPSATKSQADNYASVTGDNGTYAVYCLEYESASTNDISVSFYSTFVQYKNANGTVLEDEDLKAHLDNNISYAFILERDPSFEFDSNNLPTATTWVKKSDDGLDNTIKYDGIQRGGGYILCYVRLDYSEDLVRPVFDGVQINFTIGTIIENV